MTSEVKLYKIPEILETARILDDSVLEKYNDSFQDYNEKARQTLGEFGRADGELTGSSPFMLVHLANSGLLPSDSRLATRKDLETATQYSPEFLSGRYVDFGLVLKTAGDSHAPNDFLSKRLAEQLKQRNIVLGNGKLIPLNALTLAQNNDSAYGLVFDLNGEAKNLIRDLAEFNWSYTKDSGLACACLSCDRDWNSVNVRLNSGSDGRVVVVNAEGTSQNSNNL